MGARRGVADNNSRRGLSESSALRKIPSDERTKSTSSHANSFHCRSVRPSTARTVGSQGAAKPAWARTCLPAGPVTVVSPTFCVAAPHGTCGTSPLSRSASTTFVMFALTPGHALRVGFRHTDPRKGAVTIRHALRRPTFDSKSTHTHPPHFRTSASRTGGWKVSSRKPASRSGSRASVRFPTRCGRAERTMQRPLP